MFTAHRSNFTTGELLGRRYEVVRILGSGTLGTTYLVRDRDLGRARVALKVLHPGTFEDEAALTGVRQAVAQIRQLSHPSICRCYDFIKLSNGVWGIAFEYVPGISLAEVIGRAKSQPITPDEVLYVAAHTGRALHFAHSAGIVHGNVHPANILLGKNGSLKITDFMLNSAIPAQFGLTRSRTLLGVPRFLSPEQISGKPATASSDVFSLAAITAELLSGSKPSQNRGLTAQLQQQLRLQLSDFGELPEEVSPELRRNLENALTADPALRTLTATELADSAHASLSGRSNADILSDRGSDLLLTRLLVESDLDRFRPIRVLIICLLLFGAFATLGQENVKRNIFTTVFMIEREFDISLAPIYERFGVPNVSHRVPDRIARALEYPEAWLFRSVARSGRDYATPDRNGETALGIIARKTSVAQVDYDYNLQPHVEVLGFLKYDPTTDADGRDRFLLHSAVQQTDWQFANVLVAGFPKLLQVRDAHGRRPLDRAAALDARETVKVLLRHDPAPCDVDHMSGRSAYHWAAAAGAMSALEELENAQCKTELRDRSGDTPLMLALRSAPQASVRAAAEHLHLAQSTDPAVRALAAQRGLSELFAAPVNPPR